MYCGAKWRFYVVRRPRQNGVENVGETPPRTDLSDLVFLRGRETTLERVERPRQNEMRDHVGK